MEAFRGDEVRLEPYSTIDIRLSATSDGRRISGTSTGFCGAVDSLRRESPKGCDLASGNEPVGLLIAGMVLSEVGATTTGVS
jgi:hypothetical protein